MQVKIRKALISDIVGAAIINRTQLDTYREADRQYVLPDEEV